MGGASGVALVAVADILRVGDFGVVMNTVLVTDHHIRADTVDAIIHLPGIVLFLEHVRNMDLMNHVGHIHTGACFRIDHIRVVAQGAQSIIPPPAAMERERVVAGIAGIRGREFANIRHCSTIRAEIEKRVCDREEAIAIQVVLNLCADGVCQIRLGYVDGAVEFEFISSISQGSQIPFPS